MNESKCCAHTKYTVAKSWDSCRKWQNDIARKQLKQPFASKATDVMFGCGKKLCARYRLYLAQSTAELPIDNV